MVDDTPPHYACHSVTERFKKLSPPLFEVAPREFYLPGVAFEEVVRSLFKKIKFSE